MNYRRIIPVFAFGALLLASCAPPKAVPVPSKVIPTPKAANVDLAPAAKSAASIATTNQAATAGVERATKELGTMRADLKRATAEADRLRQAKVATALELEDNFHRLQAMEATAARAEEEATMAKTALAEQRGTAEALQQELGKQRDLALGKQAEADGLRRDFEKADTDRAAVQHAYDQQAGALADAKRREHLLSGEIRIYRIVLGLLVLIAIVFVLIKIYV